MKGSGFQRLANKLLSQSHAMGGRSILLRFGVVFIFLASLLEEILEADLILCQGLVIIERGDLCTKKRLASGKWGMVSL